MPLLGEQPDNIARAEDRGYGLSVSVKKLDYLAKDTERAIRRILNEPAFGANAARISRIMRAHRLTPAEVAASKQVHYTQGLLAMITLPKLGADTLCVQRFCTFDDSTCNVSCPSPEARLIYQFVLCHLVNMHHKHWNSWRHGLRLLLRSFLFDCFLRCFRAFLPK